MLKQQDQGERAEQGESAPALPTLGRRLIRLIPTRPMRLIPANLIRSVRIALAKHLHGSIPKDLFHDQ